MRECLLFGLFAACFVLVACGGSSSETPPPLQPDPKGFHYASAPAPRAVEDNDGGALPSANEPEPSEKPRAPAPSTWGSRSKPH